MPTAAAVAAIMAATATSIQRRNRRFLPLNQAAQLRINGSNHGKDSDSEQQAEKHNLCSLVTEQANAGSRQTLGAAAPAKIPIVQKKIAAGKVQTSTSPGPFS